MANENPLSQTEIILGGLIKAALVGNYRWQEWPEGTGEWWKENGVRYEAHEAAQTRIGLRVRADALAKLSPEERAVLNLG